LQQGGAETQALYLAGGLKRSGYQVKVLSFGVQGGLAWDKFKTQNIHVSFTGFREKLLIPPFVGFKKLYLYFKYKIKFIRIIRSINPDIIIPFTYAPNYIVADNKKWFRAKTFWNQRDEGRMFKGLTREIKALNSANHIISNSTEGKRFLARYTKRNIHLIFNGVQITELNDLSTLTNHSAIFRVVMVANLHHYKDHLTLLKAWKRISEKFPDKNLELLLVGRFGTRYEEIIQFINRNDLTRKVQLLGPVENIQALLSDVHLGVLSSTHEGLPNAILEYMERGLPVVATRINGSEDALGKNYPFLTAPGDDAAMTDAMIQIMLDPVLAKNLGKRNRERVIAEFSMDKMVDAYESLF
jgi:glycosyltransferase involved in cell wall biosynthesis